MPSLSIRRRTRKAAIMMSMILPRSPFPPCTCSDWPDIYIHTDHDALSQIDATKLRRVALLGAASGYTYAALRSAQVPEFLPFFAARSQQRLAKSFERAQGFLRNGTIAPCRGRIRSAQSHCPGSTT